MNPMNHEFLEILQEYVEAGDWRDPKEGFRYDEKMKYHYGVYTAPWFMDLTEEEFEAINWDDDETDHYSFHLALYIWADNSFKLEFDPGLFNLMYKGYDTEEDRSAWEEFKEFIRQKGLLYEK